MLANTIPAMKKLGINDFMEGNSKMGARVPSFFHIGPSSEQEGSNVFDWQPNKFGINDTNHKDISTKMMRKRERRERDVI